MLRKLLLAIVLVLAVSGNEHAKMGADPGVCNTTLAPEEADDQTAYLQVRRANDTREDGIMCGYEWGDNCKHHNWYSCCLFRSIGCNAGLECLPTTTDLNPCHSCSKPHASVSIGEGCADNSECMAGLTCAYATKTCCTNDVAAMSWAVCSKFIPFVTPKIVGAEISVFSAVVCNALTASFTTACGLISIETGPLALIPAGTCLAAAATICGLLISAASKKAFQGIAKHISKADMYGMATGNPYIALACDYLASGPEACSPTSTSAPARLDVYDMNNHWKKPGGEADCSWRCANEVDGCARYVFDPVTLICTAFELPLDVYDMHNHWRNPGGSADCKWQCANNVNGCDSYNFDPDTLICTALPSNLSTVDGSLFSSYPFLLPLSSSGA